MGRRKSKRKPPPKQKRTEALAVVFPCPFCSHDRSCEVKIDRKGNVGKVECRMCRESYSTSVHYLSEAVDVYNSWIDACEEQNRDYGSTLKFVISDDEHEANTTIVSKNYLWKSLADINELPLSYRHLTKGRQFTVCDKKLRALRQNDSTAELYCFQRSTNGKEAQLISSSVESYTLVHDIDPPTDCVPNKVIFRPEFPKQVKLRCLPLGSNEPKVAQKSKAKKKRKRLND